jgi:hypothetical protein
MVIMGRKLNKADQLVNLIHALIIVSLIKAHIRHAEQSQAWSHQGTLV